MNQYLIPANANRGKLIMGFFRAIDLAIFGAGAGTTFILVLVFQNQMQQLGFAILVLIPVLVTGFLVIPIPNQHNILVFLQCMYRFFQERRVFYWKGWCMDYGEESEAPKK